MKKAFLILGGLLVVFLLIPFIPIETEHKGPKTHLVYITHNPIHTGIAFPKNNDWNEFGQGHFIEFSWGDRDFFVNVPTWDKLTLPLALNALFSPDPGLMHVDLLKGMKVPHVKVMITEEQYHKLRQFIMNSFVLKEGKPVVYPGHSYYGTDTFYLSNQNYHALHTCNNWTRQALEAAGIRTGLWTYHKWGVLSHL